MSEYERMSRSECQVCTSAGVECRLPSTSRFCSGRYFRGSCWLVGSDAIWMVLTTYFSMLRPYFSKFNQAYGVAISFFFFFFQAEDGIRDWSVTGVQTCALPI